MHPSRSSGEHLQVLYVEGAIGFGGSGKSLVELVRSFSGVEAHVLVTSASVLGSSNEFSVYVDRSLAAGPDSATSTFRRYLDDFRSLIRWVTAVISCARRVRAQLLHANNSVSGNLPVLLAGRILGLPVVVHQRGFLEPSLRLRVALKILGRTPVIAISQAIAQNLVDCGVPQQNVIQIYDVVAFPAAIKAAEAMSRGATVHIGMHSVLTAWKGQSIFIQAAAILLERLPGQVHFHIAGSTLPGESAYEEQLRTAVTSAGLQSHVTFWGHIQDVYSFLREIDISVHASLVPEPLGRVIIEAQLAGVCVIAADAGGARELVDESSGVLVRPGDPGALADALAELVQAPVRRRSLAEAGQRRARKVFGSSTLAEDVEHLYERVRTS